MTKKHPTQPTKAKPPILSAIHLDDGRRFPTSHFPKGITCVDGIIVTPEFRISEGGALMLSNSDDHDEVVHLAAWTWFLIRQASHLHVRKHLAEEKSR